MNFKVDPLPTPLTPTNLQRSSRRQRRTWRNVKKGSRSTSQVQSSRHSLTRGGEDREPQPCPRQQSRWSLTAPSIRSGYRQHKTVRYDLWQPVQSCRWESCRGLELEVSWIRNFCGFLVCSCWPKTKRFGGIWSQESLGLIVTFEGICRPLECVKKSLRRKRTGNSLVGFVPGSNFKRKGIIDLGWWIHNTVYR